MEKNLLITNIQRFCLSDGPGIRTNCFFKGCTVKCPWCCNPENINSCVEEYYDENGKMLLFGEYYSNDEVFEILLKDKSFYGRKGGVTFSGGEALLQFYKFEPLLKMINDAEISICLETSLFVDNKVLNDSFKYLDYYIVDIKILDDDKCRKIIGGNISLFNYNFDALLKSNKCIILRLPVIKDYTNDDNNKSKIISFIKSIADNKSLICIELLKGHNLARYKYKCLASKNRDIVFKEIGDISDTEMNDYKLLIEKVCPNVPVNILKI